ncbi:Pal1 cell morphology protein-domain-containing protein [Mycena rosella]|uniref:Pal1 cell morphology protein-domain-containing protein n=1 Tax=Mycena rosella TaxID=1033263 RepID=A0AAD7M8V2_MYCRO|nr:Pal1 cell morphology protein-domain-containing protein [Mycena rosella]
MSAAVQSRPRPEDDPFADDKGSPTHLRAPPPPPKKSKQPPPRTKDIVEEVRDTVIVRGSPNRMARSQTSKHANNSPRTAAAPQLGPRSLSQDSVPVDKKKSRKKGSQHADVIDRLDYTGVGPMFHHDGPFDACAPSRNRQKNRAPMMAWSARPEDAPKEFNNDNPYPSPHAMAAFSPTEYEPPKKKVDAIAEAWGIHEPEPYEEFFAGGGGGGTTGNTPASSIYNGKESSRKTPESSRSRAHARRSQLPPPMPIFVPDSVVDNTALPDSPGSPGSFPKRNKSLMHRIRKMRDAPNVPVHDDESPAEPTSERGERPTHRHQNSFLGRFAGNGRAAANNTNISPTSENSESYVFIEPRTAAKDLPPTPGNAPPTSPPEHSAYGYFDDPEATPPSAGAGLGRKTSLMKKVGRVVRGTK